MYEYASRVVGVTAETFGYDQCCQFALVRSREHMRTHAAAERQRMWEGNGVIAGPSELEWRHVRSSHAPCI